MVNAQVESRAPDDDSPRTPGLLRQLRGAVDVPIDRQSVVAAAATEIHLTEISVATARNRVAADSIRDIPTGLRLTAAQFQLIRRFVRDELAWHPGWQRLQEGGPRGVAIVEQTALAPH